SSGQRAVSGTLRVTLAPRSAPPGSRSSRCNAVPRSPSSIWATARSQRLASFAAVTSGRTESRIQSAAGMPWTARISARRSGRATRTGNHADRHGVRDRMALIYLLLFASPQLLLYLYLRERLPLSARRWLTLLFVVFNIPWGIVAVRMFSGSLWGISRVPYIAPWIAWQLLGWIFCGLVAVYILGKAVGRFGGW